MYLLLRDSFDSLYILPLPKAKKLCTFFFFFNVWLCFLMDEGMRRRTLFYCLLEVVINCLQLKARMRMCKSTCKWPSFYSVVFFFFVLMKGLSMVLQLNNPSENTSRVWWWFCIQMLMSWCCEMKSRFPLSCLNFLFFFFVTCEWIHVLYQLL